MNKALLVICLCSFVLFCIEVVTMTMVHSCPAPLPVPKVQPRVKPFSDFIGVFWDSKGTFQSRNVVFTYMKYLVPQGWDFHMFVTDKSLAFYRRNGTFAELEEKKCLTFSVIPPFDRNSFVFVSKSIMRHRKTHKHVDDRWMKMQVQAWTWEQVPGEMILSFQYDSMMCNKSKKRFEDFSRFVKCIFVVTSCFPFIFFQTGLRTLELRSVTASCTTTVVFP